VSTLRMLDCSQPAKDAPRWPVQAFYVGGLTPHIWTDDEVKAIKAKYGLPIYVQVDPRADPLEDAAKFFDWLTAHGWQHGEAVAADTEDVDMREWLQVVNNQLTAAGYKLIDYQSKGVKPLNPVTSGGAWVADWTDEPHLMPGTIATQYLPASHSGLDYDASLISTDVHLHQLNPTPLPPVPRYQVTVALPALYQGTDGPAVRNLQGLLNAQRPAAIQPLMIDGDFGTLTRAALIAYQAAHLNEHIPGVAGPLTWHALLGV